MRNSLILLSGIAATLSAMAQPQLLVRQIADLNPGTNGSFASNLTLYGSGEGYFSAYTVATGRELWKSDGHTITLVSNINNTVTDIGFGTFVGNDSAPYSLAVFGGALNFAAFDPRRGGELWCWDGTNAFRVADLNPDANDLIKTSPASSWPYELIVLGEQLCFAANGGPTTNYEPWRYSGILPTLATNIHPDVGTDSSSYPRGLFAWSGALYFMADDGSRGFELWKYSPAGGVLMDVNPGDQRTSSYPKYFTPFNNHLYFQAFHDSYGFELWRTDGTNVFLVSDISPGAGSSFPENLKVFGNALYFSATDGVSGHQLWRYDGASASLVARINQTGDAFPKNLTVFKERLYCSADDGVQGWELWQYDGSSGSLVTNLNSVGDSFPESLTLLNDALYFTATTPETGYELWRFDGTNVMLAADLNAGPGSSFPRNFAVINGELWFSAAADGLSDWELWALTEKRPAGPVSILDPHIVGTDFIFSFQSEPAATYEVQCLYGVTPTDWQVLCTNTGTGSLLTFTNAVLPGEHRLYRVQSK